MRSEERQRLYRNLKESNPAWRLLSRESAPMILAFLGDLFSQEPEVSMDRARAELEIILQRNNVQDPRTTARLYISNWINDGWMREQHHRVTITSAAQTALQFVDGLGHRDLTATASHLETVNEEMRKLLVMLSPDVEERQALIDEQIRDLEAARQRLLDGHSSEISPAQKREHVRHVYNLAMALTQDFRYLEDEMRRHEMAVHQRILDGQDSRGELLGGVLDAEDLMRNSPAGQAFEGFYGMLSDHDRSIAFRTQIKRLFALGVGEYLSADEHRYLAALVGELLSQSDRVIDRRRNATESLKAYMLSGAQEEHRAIDRLLKQALQVASKLAEAAGDDWRQWAVPSELTLNTGRVSLRSPAVISLTHASDFNVSGDIEEQAAGRYLSDDALNKLTGFRLGELASRVRQRLRESGSRTIGELAHIEPITGGIEEVLGLIRIGKATGAISLEATEQIYVTDARRGLLRVEIPSLLLRPEGFPDDLEELNA